MGSMKVHQLTRGAFWDQHEPSLSLGACKRLRPLAPKLTIATSANNVHDTTLTSLDLKTFIKVGHSEPRKSTSNEDNNKRDPHSTHQVEAHSGGTRWNPTQEQIGILEMLYRGGMRTPNAQQIEQITAQLGRYGKIEGKNVFYWFQNHKARERQKQKRNNLGLVHSPRTPPATTTTTTMTSDASGLSGEVVEREELDSPYKRKQRSWGIEFFEEESKTCRHDDQDGSDKTLELFPLHPEGR